MCGPAAPAFAAWLSGLSSTAATTAAGTAGALSGVGAGATAGAAATTAAGITAGTTAVTTLAAPVAGGSALGTTSGIVAAKAAGGAVAKSLLSYAGKAAVGIGVSSALTPDIPKASPPPSLPTVDPDAARMRSDARTREQVFGGRRGTLLVSSSGSPAVFNTGRKKLLGQ